MYIQSPSSNLMFKVTLATRSSRLPMDKPLPSSRRPAFNKNSLLSPMTFPEHTSSMLRRTPHVLSVLRQPRTQNLLTSLVSHLSSSLIRLV